MWWSDIHWDHKTILRLLCVQQSKIIPAMTNISYTALVLPLCRRINQEIISQLPMNGVFLSLRACLHKRRQPWLPQSSSPLWCKITSIKILSSNIRLLHPIFCHSCLPSWFPPQLSSRAMELTHPTLCVDTVPWLCWRWCAGTGGGIALLPQHRVWWYPCVFHDFLR